MCVCVCVCVCYLALFYYKVRIMGNKYTSHDLLHQLINKCAKKTSIYPHDWMGRK